MKYKSRFSCIAPKDEARVLRSIESITRKIEASIAMQVNRRSSLPDDEFEKLVTSHGLIYFP